jgi:hypothetical protein
MPTYVINDGDIASSTTTSGRDQGWLAGGRLVAWYSLRSDTARKRLTSRSLGSGQERALRQVVTAAIELTVEELCPEGGERARDLTMIMGEVSRVPVPEIPTRSQGTLLEALQAGIAAQLAPLDDPGLAGTRKSLAKMFGISATVLAEKLTNHAVREITIRGARGGPLAPLAAQLNYDMTHLQAQRLEGMLERFAEARLDVGMTMERVRRQGTVPGHAFISYAREDSDRVDQLQRTLQIAGVPVWRDTADLWPGEDWRVKIRRAITDNALVFIEVISGK